MKKLIILQTTAPDYRSRVFKEIKNQLGDRFELMAGDQYFESSIKMDKSLPFVKKVRNRFLFGRRFLVQTGMWKSLLKTEVAVLEMNPRILSNWIILLLRKLLKKKTILWGHAWPRSGKGSKSDSLRNLMRNMAHEIVVYTDTQKRELQERMPDKKIYAAPNALYSCAEMQPGKEEPEKIRNIIFVGRLTKEKKSSLLVEAFIDSLNQLPADANLIIVGEGEEMEKIKQLVAFHNLWDRILLKGHVSDYHTLSELYATSLFSVSPGYVGLSLTQSLGFGVPMLISKDENHSPEIEAAAEGLNAAYFETDNAQDLGTKMKLTFDKKDFWVNQREEISRLSREKYSVEAMASTFIQFAK